MHFQSSVVARLVVSQLLRLLAHSTVTFLRISHSRQFGLMQMARCAGLPFLLYTRMFRRLHCETLSSTSYLLSWMRFVKGAHGSVKSPFVSCPRYLTLNELYSTESESRATQLWSSETGAIAGSNCVRRRLCYWIISHRSCSSPGSRNS